MEKILRSGGMAVTGGAAGAERYVAQRVGSRVVLVLVDPLANVLGAAFVGMPASAALGKQAERFPALFADRAVDALVLRMAPSRKEVDGGGLMAVLVGGAGCGDVPEALDLGGRIVGRLREELAAWDIAVAAADVGGPLNRTVCLDPDCGVRVAAPGKGERQVFGPLSPITGDGR